MFKLTYQSSSWEERQGAYIEYGEKITEVDANSWTEIEGFVLFEKGDRVVLGVPTHRVVLIEKMAT